MERDWNERKLVGNEAENIVEYLISSTPNWKCFRFGIENHIQEIRRIVKDKINSTTRQIKSMPDFVAFNDKTGESFFVEVKYRSRLINSVTKKTEYRIKFLEEYKQYWPGTRLIILQNSEPYLFSVNLDYLDGRRCTRIKGESPAWNFEGIMEDVRSVFQGLKEETLKEVQRRISRR